MATPAKKNGDILGQYASHCPNISDTAQYWFLRTVGGSLFEPFITSQSVAIGYPYIDLKTLMGLSFNKDGIDKLKKQIKANDPTEERPGLAARQLLVFTHAMKEGDYVVIPSFGTRSLAIGRITEKPPFQSPLKFNGEEMIGYAKRRSVRWIKRVQRESVNANLYLSLYAHQTISNVTDSSQWTDMLLFDFFKKGKNFHYILRVDRMGGIDARELFQACIDLFKLADDFTSEYGITGTGEKMETRINLNSPGEIELISHGVEYMIAAAALVVTLSGGGFKSETLKIDLHTDGLIKKINDFLNDRKQRQLSDSLRKKFDDLKVKRSADIIRMIEKNNKPKP